MKKSIDFLLGIEYNKDSYNCAHFTADAYEYLTGTSLTQQMKGLLHPLPSIQVDIGIKNHWQRLTTPVEVCIVLMGGKGKESHVGVYYNNKILHIKESGVAYVEPSVVSFQYNYMRYYAPIQS